MNFRNLINYRMDENKQTDINTSSSPMNLDALSLNQNAVNTQQDAPVVKEENNQEAS